MKKIRLFTPGPCTVPEEVLIEMARPFEHHRTKWFRDLFTECTEKLQQVFNTKSDVLIITGSGTAAAEGAIVGINGPGSKMLTIEGGKFGERWGKICDAHGIAANRHQIPWGTAIDAATIEKLIKDDPAITSVMVVHSETSTATACDLQAIAKVCRDHDKLLLADCITSCAALPLKPDEWGVDVVITGSQKALMLPPGLGFVSINDRAWKAINANNDQNTFYLNLPAAKKAADKGDTPYTPAHLLVRGLRVALDMILDEGLENVWKRVAAMANATRNAATALNVKVYSQSPSDSVTALVIPDGIAESDVRGQLKDRYGIHTAGGQDDLKGKIVRFSHMGYIDTVDMLGAIGAFERTLFGLGHKCELGAGVAAAQKVFAEQS